MRRYQEDSADHHQRARRVASSSLVRWTTKSLPRDARLKTALGVPMAIVVHPLDPRASCESLSDVASADRIARCSGCFGYVSAHCVVDHRGFACATCGTYTPWREASRGKRYVGRGLAAIQDLPEIRSEAYEFDVAVEAISGADDGEEEEALEETDWRRRAVRNDASGTRASNARAIVAVVDLNEVGDEYCELVKLALASALEALEGEDARFGVVTFRGDCLEAVNFGVVERGGDEHRTVRLSYFDSHANPRKHGFIRRVSDVVTGLEDVLTMLAPRGKWKEWRSAVSDAIDALIVAGEENEESGSAGRIFGPVLEETLSIIEQAIDDGLISSARILTFLRGGPSRGVGSCDVGRLPKSIADVLLRECAAKPTMEDFEFASREAEALMSPAHDYYEIVGERCLLLGVEVDVVMTSDTFTDLSTLAPLAERSGGNVLLYPNDRNIPIVGDVYRLLRNEKAINATLRVRTTADLEIANAYGALHADKAYSGLYHIASCGVNDAFCFDFDYATSGGLEDELNRGHPKVQVAFEYTCITRDTDEQTGAVIAVHRRRRRRIHTCRVNIARHSREVYKYVDVGAMMCVLARQTSYVAREEGLTEARRALVDWLVDFAENAESDNTSWPELGSEIIPRLVYGLLASKVFYPIGAQPDERTVSRLQMLRLDADESVRMMYPDLYEFIEDEDRNQDEKEASEAGESSRSNPTMFSNGRLPLRRESLSQSKLLLLRSADELVVIHADAETCPPRFGGPLEREIRRIRESRTFSPRVTHVRLGLDDPAPADALLVEHTDSEFNEPGYDGFVGFREFCRLQTIRGTAPKSS